MKDIKPNYYRRNINGVEIDVNDIADAFDLGYQAQNALKYLIRAGRKDETTLVDDLVKARHYIDRLIKKHVVAEDNANEDQTPQSLNDACVDLSYGAAVTKEEVTKAVDTIQLFKQMRDRDTEPRAEGPEIGTRNTTAFAKTLAAPEQHAVATAWPCWIATRHIGQGNDDVPVRDPYHSFAGPYLTRDEARRALDPSRTDQRVVMADDPGLIPHDVIERLFT